MSETPESAFIEQLGLIYQAEGMPRIAGRIIGLLILDPRPYGFDEISRCLKVSRASVSTNTRLLETWGIIDRVSRPGERQDFFQLSRRPYAQMMERQLDRTRRVRELIAQAQSRIPDDHDVAKGRVGELIRFYDIVAATTEGALKQFQDRHKKPG